MLRFNIPLTGTVRIVPENVVAQSCMKVQVAPLSMEYSNIIEPDAPEEIVPFVVIYKVADVAGTLLNPLRVS